MAVTTHTASAAREPAYKLHAGLMSRSAKFVAPATTTIGDTILMMKVPSGVDIVGVYGKITTLATNANATIGIQGADTLFGSLASGASPIFAALGAQNYRLSLSDSAQPQFTYITVAPSTATWTITASVEVTVLYRAV